MENEKWDDVKRLVKDFSFLGSMVEFSLWREDSLEKEIELLSKTVEKLESISDRDARRKAIKTNSGRFAYTPSYLHSTPPAGVYSAPAFTPSVGAFSTPYGASADSHPFIAGKRGPQDLKADLDLDRARADLEDAEKLLTLTKADVKNFRHYQATALKQILEELDAFTAASEISVTDMTDLVALSFVRMVKVHGPVRFKFIRRAIETPRIVQMAAYMGLDLAVDGALNKVYVIAEDSHEIVVLQAKLENVYEEYIQDVSDESTTNTLAFQRVLGKSKGLGIQRPSFKKGSKTRLSSSSSSATQENVEGEINALKEKLKEQQEENEKNVEEIAKNVEEIARLKSGFESLFEQLRQKGIVSGPSSQFLTPPSQANDDGVNTP